MALSPSPISAPPKNIVPVKIKHNQNSTIQWSIDDDKSDDDDDELIDEILLLASM